MTIVGITGHRPEKLGGYYPNALATRVRTEIRVELSRLKPVQVVIGMAQGTDQWTARICIVLGIPFIAAVPCDGQDRKWPRLARAEYAALLKAASRVELITPGPYKPGVMDVRNEWMVDHSDIMLAVWNGTPGGTANCVEYAEKRQVPIVRINPMTLGRITSS